MKRFLYLFLLIAGLCFVLALSAGAAYTCDTRLQLSDGTLASTTFPSKGTYTVDALVLQFSDSSLDASDVIAVGNDLVFSGSIDSPLNIPANIVTSNGSLVSGNTYVDSVTVYGVPASHPAGSYVQLGSFGSDDFVSSASTTKFGVNFYSQVPLRQAIKSSPILVYFNFSSPIVFKTTSAQTAFFYRPSETCALNSQSGSTTAAMVSAAQKIIDSLGADIQLGNNELINIRQYVHSLYEFFTRPFTDVDGTNYVYDWNMYVTSTIKFLSALQSQNQTTHDKLTSLINNMEAVYIALGFNPETSSITGDYEWETLKTALKTMNSSILAAIENGVTEAFNNLDEAYSNVDTSTMDSASSDTNTMISESDAIESGLMQSATDAMGDINLDTPGIGSQTLSALVALLPFYDGFFTASGEVGLVRGFSLAVGIVLLLIGRSGIAFISRVEHASRNKDGDDL